MRPAVRQSGVEDARGAGAHPGQITVGQRARRALESAVDDELAHGWDWLRHRVAEAHWAAAQNMGRCAGRQDQERGHGHQYGEPPRAARETTRFDLVGAAGLGVVLLAAAWVLVSLGRAVDPVTVAIGVAVLPAAVALLRYESRHPDPALPPSLFRIRAFAAACATVAFQNLAMYGTLLALPVALAGASVRSGIALAAFSGGSIILAPVGGRAADRYGPRLPTFAGALLLGVGLAPLAISAGQLPLELLAATLAFAGVGLALTFPIAAIANPPSVGPTIRAARSAGNA